MEKQPRWLIPTTLLPHSSDRPFTHAFLFLFLSISTAERSYREERHRSSRHDDRERDGHRDRDGHRERYNRRDDERRDRERYGRGRDDDYGGGRHGPRYDDDRRHRREDREGARGREDRGERRGNRGRGRESQERRSPTPDNCPALAQRKRKASGWDVHAPGYEQYSAMQAKQTGM